MRKDRVQAPFEWGAVLLSAVLLIVWFALAVLVKQISNQSAAVIITLKIATILFLPVIGLVIAQMFMRRSLWRIICQLLREVDWPEFHTLYPFILLTAIISGCAYVMHTQSEVAVVSQMEVPSEGKTAPMVKEQGKKATVKKTVVKKPSSNVRIVQRVPAQKIPRRLSDRRVAYEPIIYAASKRHGVPPALVMAVTHVESGFNPLAISPKGAKGLMQLHPDTAKRYAVRDSFDPKSNVEGGVKYLRFLLDRYKWNVKLAIAAYNSGEGNVDKYGKVPPFAETKKFVPNVLAQYKIYKKRQSNQLAFNF